MLNGSHMEVSILSLFHSVLSTGRVKKLPKMVRSVSLRGISVFRKRCKTVRSACVAWC